MCVATDADDFREYAAVVFTDLVRLGWDPAEAGGIYVALCRGDITPDDVERIVTRLDDAN